MALNECFKCGISGERAVLLDVISGKGIVKLCKNCAGGEYFPVVKRKTEFQIKEAEARPSVYERLLKMSGIDRERGKRVPASALAPEKKRELEEQKEEQEAKLRQIVEKNLEVIIPSKKISTEHLVDNFHWAIMRSRRLKKLAQKELAQKINEPETAIKMAEQGIISSETPRLISKLEDYLGIRLRKSETGFPVTDFSSFKSFKDSAEQSDKHIAEQRARVLSDRDESELINKPTTPALSFDPGMTKRLTIADLKAMKEGREGKASEEKKKKWPWEEVEEENKEEIKEEVKAELKEEITEEKEKPFDERELTDEEIEDILYGRK